jgi:hypothetical protein
VVDRPIAYTFYENGYSFRILGASTTGDTYLTPTGDLYRQPDGTSHYLQP